MWAHELRAAVALAYVSTRHSSCFIYLRHRADACFLERVAIAPRTRPRALFRFAYGVDGQRCARCDHQLARPLGAVEYAALVTC